MDKIFFNNEYWPNTKRTFPENAKLEVRVVHSKWQDLCWYDSTRDCYVYLSTLPKK